MGWTSTQATCFDRHYRIDRKAECINMISSDVQVLKASMVGSVFYAAVRDTIWPPDEVFAVIILTSVNNKTLTFSFKIMDETEGPTERNCPRSILEMLTPISSPVANEWRKDCWANLDKLDLGKLPVGTIIRCEANNTRVRHMKKCGANHQFKAPYWLILNENMESTGTYYMKNHIKSDFSRITVVSMPEKQHLQKEG